MSDAGSRQPRLYAVLDEGPVSVEVPAGGSLYDGLEQGVYTALRTFKHNCFLDLGQHLRRLRGSMVRFGMQVDLDTERLCRALHEVSTAYPDGDMRVRIDVLAEPATARGVSSRELIALTPFTPPDPEKYRRGVSVITTRALQRADPLTKSASFADRRDAVMASHPEVEDCLLVNDQGMVLEGASSNFYGLCDDVLYTAGEGVLEGITRSIVLDLAHRSGVAVRLDALSLAQLATASEAAISSSSRGLMPVTRIDGQPVGSAQVGPVMSMLHQAYEEHVTRAARPAVDRRQRGSGQR